MLDEVARVTTAKLPIIRGFLIRPLLRILERLGLVSTANGYNCERDRDRHCLRGGRTSGSENEVDQRPRPTARGIRLTTTSVRFQPIGGCDSSSQRDSPSPFFHFIIENRHLCEKQNMSLSFIYLQYLLRLKSTPDGSPVGSNSWFSYSCSDVTTTSVCLSNSFIRRQFLVPASLACSKSVSKSASMRAAAAKARPRRLPRRAREVAARRRARARSTPRH